MPTANTIAGAVCTHVMTEVLVWRSAAMSGNDADRSVDGKELEKTPTMSTTSTYQRKRGSSWYLARRASRRLADTGAIVTAPDRRLRRRW
jgi:hypothetical protein